MYSFLGFFFFFFFQTPAGAPAGVLLAGRQPTENLGCWLPVRKPVAHIDHKEYQVLSIEYILHFSLNYRFESPENVHTTLDAFLSGERHAHFYEHAFRVMCDVRYPNVRNPMIPAPPLAGEGLNDGIDGHK